MLIDSFRGSLSPPSDAWEKNSSALSLVIKNGDDLLTTVELKHKLECENYGHQAMRSSVYRLGAPYELVNVFLSIMTNDDTSLTGRSHETCS